MSLAGRPDRRSASALTRRSWLRLGALGATGLFLPRLLAAQAPGRPAPPASACVLLLLQGGPSQLDIWDPKPDAPEQVRGPFRPIDTSVPGIRIVEHLPRLARMAHRFTVVRSMTHANVFHNAATYYTLTGQPPPRDATALDPSDTDPPHLGAVLALARPAAGHLPSAVSLPNPIGEGLHTIPGQDAGFLGARYAPFYIAADPGADDFAVDGLAAVAEAGPGRLEGRRALLEAVERGHARPGPEGPVGCLDAHQRRALALLTSGAARRAFELGREPDHVRDRYGRHKPGQSLLLARRLVEAGVRLVTVYWGGRLNKPLPYWDTHEDLRRRLRDELLPPFDQAFSALLEDLDGRGLLGTTLVACLGEFGRTPRMGQFTGNGGDPTGRDHWPHCYSIVVAGGAAGGGRVLGRSDRLAAYPAEDPYTPRDLAATILRELGVDPGAEVRDGFGRRVPLSAGEYRASLFSG